MAALWPNPMPVDHYCTGLMCLELTMTGCYRLRRWNDDVAMMAPDLLLVVVLIVLTSFTPVILISFE